MKLALALAGLIALGWMGACLDDPGGPEVPLPPPGFLVSDPVPASAAGGPQQGASFSLADEESVVYVSLLPGTEPQGVTATVRALTSDSTVTTTVHDGGFDPVPIPAQVGDTIEVIVRDGSGAVVLSARIAVARPRPPIVVRTDPPPKKRDVPLNSVMVVVFSEPIDAATLSATTVYLLEGQTAIAGRLEFTDEAQLTAALVPDAPLSPGTDYVLEVTRGISDLDGDSLEAAVAVEFTSVTVQPQLTFTVQPTNMGVGLAITPHVQVTARNASGSTDSTFMGSIGITIGTRPGAASLSGTTTLTASAGVATFTDLRIDAVGPGYTLLASASGYSGATSAPFEITPVGPLTGAIAFAVPGMGLYVMQPDGSGRRQVTWEHGDKTPAVSPDGSQLLFARGSSWGARDHALYTINIDGSGLTLLTNDQFPGHYFPAWSPDGQWIALSACSPMGCDVARIWVMNANGSGLYQLTNNPPWVAEDGATWSPDGSRIAFASSLAFGDLGGQGFSRHLYVVNRNGSGLVRLTLLDYGAAPSWSPDGTKIVYESQCCSTDFTEIKVRIADGSGVVTLREGRHPSWSPDGSRIAFEREGGIYVMNADGSGLVSLGAGVSPAWGRLGALPSTQLTIERAPHPNGDGQVDTVLATLPAPLRVRVLRGGVPEGGVEVRWTTNHGSVSPATVRTDTAGIAKAYWTLGQRTLGGPPNEMALASAWIGQPQTSGSQVATFGATPRPGNAAELWLEPVYEHVGAVNAPLPWGLMVGALDAHGNPFDSASISALPLTWNVIGGGFVTPGRIEYGYATATFTLGPAEGVQVAELTSPAVPGVRLTHSARAVTALVIHVHTTGGCPSPDSVAVVGRFEPLQVTVSADQTVGWFVDPTCAIHSVTFEDDPTSPISADPFGHYSQAFHTRRFTAPGTYRYRCTVHSTSFTDGEVGVVLVH